jgi:hypothetical protein
MADREVEPETPSETTPLQKSGLATALIVLAIVIVILLIIMRYNPFGGSGS